MAQALAGLVSGGAFAAIAVCIVLMYQMVGVLNFAQSAIGGLAACASLVALTKLGWGPGPPRWGRRGGRWGGAPPGGRLWGRGVGGWPVLVGGCAGAVSTLGGMFVRPPGPPSSPPLAYLTIFAVGGALLGLLKNMIVAAL